MRRFQAWHDFVVVWGSIVLVVASLYFARTVLLPVVLAILLAIILAPAANLLQRARLGRMGSVLVVVTLACLVVAGLGTAAIMQVQSLAYDIPSYKGVLSEKIEDIHGMSGGPLAEIIATFTELSEKIRKVDDADIEPQPVPVTINETPYLAWIQATLGTTFEFLINLGLVLILVIFIMLAREDLRNRFIRLSGTKSLTSTTKAIDDAYHRISRYLLMQLVVNASYGVMATLGLAIIGVPYAMLWGFFCAVLRYIPYLGPALGAMMPILLSVVLPGWAPLISVVLFFIVLELFSNNVMEIWLYGRSIGISSVAVLVTAVFWTWVWGPLGLVLATPLTACLVVLGRYVPAFSFIEVLLSDRQALPTHVALFQRLLAKDEDEANDLVADYLLTHPVPGLYDDVLLPALQRAKTAHDRDDLSAAELEDIYRTMQQILEELGATAQPEGGGAAEEPVRVPVLGCPVRDAGDELAARMFASLLDPQRYRYETLSSDTLAAELRTRLKEEEPEVLCLFVLPPGGMTQARLLCKRVRKEFPDLKILVLCWRKDLDHDRLEQQFLQAEANSFAATLLELRDKLQGLMPVLVTQTAERAAAAPL